MLVQGGRVCRANPDILGRMQNGTNLSMVFQRDDVDEKIDPNCADDASYWQVAEKHRMESFNLVHQLEVRVGLDIVYASCQVETLNWSGIWGI